MPSTIREHRDKSRDAIVRATERGGKTYAFAEAHDPDEPVEVFFQQTHEGAVLFVVVYSLACR